MLFREECGFGLFVGSLEKCLLFGLNDGKCGNFIFRFALRISQQLGVSSITP
jgi:hypothetical protein